MAPLRDSIRRAKPLLGTFVEIWAAGACPAELESAVEDAFRAIAKVHALMSFHDADSDVSRINRSSPARPVQVDPWTFAVLQTALDMHRRSAGAFDIASAAVLQKHGFLPEVPKNVGNTACAPESSSWPTEDDCAAGIELLPDRHVRVWSPSTLIDLGGIAKGFAVDRAMDLLRGRRIASSLVNAGGDLAAFGPVAHAVDIRDPVNPTSIICRVALKNRALATSGRRFDPYESLNTTVPAILDPRIENAVTATAGATVVADTCIIADALTKVVMIEGAAAAPLLEDYRAEAITISRDGAVHFTPGLRDALSRAA